MLDIFSGIYMLSQIELNYFIKDNLGSTLKN